MIMIMISMSRMMMSMWRLSGTCWRTSCSRPSRGSRSSWQPATRWSSTSSSWSPSSSTISSRSPSTISSFYHATQQANAKKHRTIFCIEAVLWLNCHLINIAAVWAGIGQVWPNFHHRPIWSMSIRLQLRESSQSTASSVASLAFVASPLFLICDHQVLIYNGQLDVIIGHSLTQVTHHHHVHCFSYQW